MSEGVAYKSVLKLADLGEPGFDGWIWLKGSHCHWFAVAIA